MSRQITKAEFEEDTPRMTHRNRETGAQALVKVSQKTSGMMMGDAYHILAQTPLGTPRVSEYTGDIYWAEARYIDLRRTDRDERAKAWLEANGFEPV